MWAGVTEKANTVNRNVKVSAHIIIASTNMSSTNTSRFANALNRFNCYLPALQDDDRAASPSTAPVACPLRLTPVRAAPMACVPLAENSAGPRLTPECWH